MTEEEIDRLQSYDWMSSRIPVRDALVASVPSGVGFPQEKIPKTYESRWFPQQDGSLRLLVLYNNQSFDQAIFHLEREAWDHTTCDLCVRRIPPMTLCYVTKPPFMSDHTPSDPYVELCVACYAKYVVDRGSLLRRIAWRTKRLIGIDGPV